MPTIFPGALWVPIPGSEKRAPRRKGRGVGLHVAVYIGPSIEKIDESTGNDSHLYVRRDGGIEQNVDLDLISYAMVDGNGTLVTVETEGGADPATVETEPWTPQQCASLARICRWVHDTEGAPLQLMPDSRPASRGVGWHKQGVDPWRVPGGEKWSTHYGKTCPGAAKIAQIPAIIVAAASGSQEDDMYDAAARTEVVGRLDKLIGEMEGVHAFASRADVVINDPTGGVRAQFAVLRGQITGLTTALGQVASGSIDLAAVTAAAAKGTTDALAEFATKVADAAAS